LEGVEEGGEFGEFSAAKSGKAEESKVDGKGAGEDESDGVGDILCVKNDDAYEPVFT
jgi:hypothetical protein